jgi:molecular chaperone GrpE
MRDRMLRALADVENTRRRAEREKQDASQYAVTRFARDMLQIADNFARALAACPPDVREAADPQVKAVLDGVEATERQLLAALERHGVKPIDTADGKFDPNFHQAIAEVPGNGKPGGSIVDVVQSGYMIGDRLLRPAMVTVARREAGNGADTKA